MLKQIIEFIDKRRIEHQAKFADAKFFREFLFKDLEKEFGNNEIEKGDPVYIVGKAEKPRKVFEIENLDDIDTECRATILAPKKLSKSERPDGGLSLKEAAEELGVGSCSIYVLASKGDIDRIRTGKGIWYSKTSINNYKIRRGENKHKRGSEIQRVKKFEEKESGKVLVQGPGNVKMEIPQNDPDEIMEDDED